MTALIIPHPRSRLPAAMSPTGEYEPIPLVTSDRFKPTRVPKVEPERFVMHSTLDGYAISQCGDRIATFEGKDSRDLAWGLLQRLRADPALNPTRAVLEACPEIAGDKPQPPKGA